MYRILFFLFVIPLCALEVDVSSNSVILMNAENGRVLFEKNGRKKSYPASVTKVATALYALEKKPDDLHTLIKSPASVLRTITFEEKVNNGSKHPPFILVSDGSSYAIKKNEVLSLKDLLYGVLLSSGNDAANVVANFVGGGVSNFMDSLNNYMSEIGLENTLFCNPHGYHDESHYTTAFDLALLTKKALENDTFCEIVSTIKFKRPKTNLQEGKELYQHNSLLLPRSKFYYPEAIGIKTGYHSESKYTLIAAAKKNDRKLIAVLLGAEKSEDRYQDATRLFNTVFQEEKTDRKIFDAKHTFLAKVQGAKTDLQAFLQKEFALSYYKSEEPKVKAFIHWEEMKLPIAKNQKVATLVIQDEQEKIIEERDLLAKEAVKGTLLHFLKTFFKR